ncbi:MAG: carboxylesterase [Pseudomonadota bacterium]|jgi:phospholipase/carboxylesterase|nr:carboxylesterase [Pseudomonadota bacterium]
MDREFDTIELEVGGTPTAAVIWLHGLGADANDFVPIVPMLGLDAGPGIRFVFPNAPVRPVTINGGMPMRAWFDIRELGGRNIDEAGIRAAGDTLDALVEREVERGIATSRIVLAGFSQGGVIALHAGLRFPRPLAGILALSTFLALADSLPGEASEANRSIPVFMAHGHHDEMIGAERALRSRDLLIDAGYPVAWHDYPMGHEVCIEEINAMGAWLAQRLA